MRFGGMVSRRRDLCDGCCCRGVRGVVRFVIDDWELVETSETGDGDGVIEADRERVIRAGRVSLREVLVVTAFLRFGPGSGPLPRTKSFSDSWDSGFRLESSEEVSGVVEMVLLFPELELLLAATFFDVWKYWFNLPLNVVILFTGTSLLSHPSCLFPCWVSTVISASSCGVEGVEWEEFGCRFEWWRITGWGIVFLIGKFYILLGNTSGEQ